VLLSIQVDAVNIAGCRDRIGIEKMAIEFHANLPVRGSRPDAFSFGTLKLLSHGSFRCLDGRGCDNQNIGDGHAGLNRSAANGRDKCGNSLGGVPAANGFHPLGEAS
jgi:hypothetical protein